SSARPTCAISKSRLPVVPPKSTLLVAAARCLLASASACAYPVSAKPCTPGVHVAARKVAVTHRDAPRPRVGKSLPVFGLLLDLMRGRPAISRAVFTSSLRMTILLFFLGASTITCFMGRWPIPVRDHTIHRHTNSIPHMDDLHLPIFV